jgi:ADP-heptose:LPS heptosyltransferase
VAKFLIIRFSSIGDIVLTTPVIRCIKQQLPGAAIHFLVKKNFKGTVENNPYIDKIHVLEDDVQQTAKQLQEEKFDFIIDLHHNLRSLRIKQALKEVKAFSFNKLNVQKYLLTAFKINTLPAKHIVDRYMETVASIAVVNDGMGLDYFIPEKDILNQEDIPLSHRNGYVALVTGATYATKKLPLHKLKQLCAIIHHPIILLGGKDEFAEGEEIKGTDPEKIYNACGKFNINKSADCVRNAKVVITHDTGLMHIAAALKKTIIAVWGSTVPEFGMYPYYGENSVQQFYNSEVKKIWCRPCSKIGYKKCPLGHFKCMEKNDVQEIAALANKLVQE